MTVLLVDRASAPALERTLGPGLRTHLWTVRPGARARSLCGLEHDGRPLSDDGHVDCPECHALDPRARRHAA